MAPRNSRANALNRYGRLQDERVADSFEDLLDAFLDEFVRMPFVASPRISVFVPEFNEGGEPWKSDSKPMKPPRNFSDHRGTSGAK